MLGRQSIADCEGSYAGSSSCLSHHATMALYRAGAVTAAVKKQQDARVVASHNDRPLTRNTVEIDCREFHVVGDRPNGTNVVEALAALCPSLRSRLRGEQGADGFYAHVVHCRRSHATVTDAFDMRTPGLDRTASTQYG